MGAVWWTDVPWASRSETRSIRLHRESWEVSLQVWPNNDASLYGLSLPPCLVSISALLPGIHCWMNRSPGLSPTLLLGSLGEDTTTCQALSQAIAFYPLEGPAKYNPGATPCPPASYCVNKVLLEHRQAHSLRTVHGGSQTTTAGLRSCDRECTGHRASNIYYLALYRKSSPGPAPRVLPGPPAEGSPC